MSTNWLSRKKKKSTTTEKFYPNPPLPLSLLLVLPEKKFSGMR